MPYNATVQAQRAKDKITEILNRRTQTAQETRDLLSTTTNPYAVLRGDPNALNAATGPMLQAFRANEINMEMKRFAVEAADREAFSRDYTNYLKATELAQKQGDREAESAMKVFNAFKEILPADKFPDFVKGFSQRGMSSNKGELGAYDQWMMAAEQVQSMGIPPEKMGKQTEKQQSQFERILSESGLSPAAQAQMKLQWLRKETRIPDGNKQAESEFERILNSMNLSPEAKEKMKMQWLEKKTAQTGENIEVGPDGTVSIRRGAGMDKVEMRNLNKDIAEIGDTYQNVVALEESFAPFFQTYAGKWDAVALEIADKTGIELTQEERMYLQDYTTHVSQANDLLSQELNRLSGAAVSPLEDARLRTYLPNPGQPGIMGILKGDSPIMFQSKLTRLKSSLEAAAMRKQFMKDNGISKETAFRAAPLEGRSKDGSVVMFSDFVKAMHEKYPTWTDNEILAAWVHSYGKPE